MQVSNTKKSMTPEAQPEENKIKENKETKYKKILPLENHSNIKHNIPWKNIYFDILKMSRHSF